MIYLSPDERRYCAYHITSETNDYPDVPVCLKDFYRSDKWLDFPEKGDDNGISWLWDNIINPTVNLTRRGNTGTL